MDKQQQLQDLERLIQEISAALEENGAAGGNLTQETVFNCGLFLRSLIEHPADPQFWRERANRASNSLAKLVRAAERDRMRNRLRG